MKAEIIVPPPSEELVTLTMTRREAEVLRCLVGGVDFGSAKGKPSYEMIRDVFSALWDAGVDPTPESFSDHFAGDVRCK